MPPIKEGSGWKILHQRSPSVKWLPRCADQTQKVWRARLKSGARPKGPCVYKIEETTLGFTLTFGGVLYREELSHWLKESEHALARRKEGFGVIVDLRNVLPLGPEAREIILQGQGLYRKAGLVRSAVVLSNSATASQFRQLAKDSLVYKNERYIDASKDSDWLKHALDWVKLQIDPDREENWHAIR